MARGRVGHRRHGGGGGNIAAAYEISIDVMLNYPVPPSLINGVYTFVGNQMSFRVQAENSIPPPQPMPQINLMQQNMMGQNMMNEMLLQDPPMPMGVPMMPMMPMTPMGMPMQSMMAPQANMSMMQANITLVGNKTKASNNCCYIFTIICGSFVIFPLCFMCCNWWKKIVYPAYQLSLEAYQNLANFIAKNPTINNLNLTVVDNAFSAQKARILYEALSRSRITGFTFNNRALQCNGQYNEADDFRTNMAPIKSMSISSSIRWGEMII